LFETVDLKVYGIYGMLVCAIKLIDIWYLGDNQ